MPFPTSPVAGVTTYTTPKGITYIYNTRGAWALQSGGSIPQATETAIGGGQIITQAEANAATAASGNDTDIVTMRKLLNLSDPGKTNFKSALGLTGLTANDLIGTGIGAIQFRAGKNATFTSASFGAGTWHSIASNTTGPTSGIQTGWENGDTWAADIRVRIA